MPPKGESRGILRKWISHLGVELIDGVYDFSLSEKSFENTRAVSGQLLANPELSLILYFNHISFADAPAILWYYRKYIDPNLTRNAILPGAYEHLDLATDPTLFRVATLGSYLLDLNIIPVVQAFDNTRSEKTATSSYRFLLEQVKNSVPCDIIISPEGHRTETGGLQQLEKGVLSLGRTLRPVMFLPVGIIPKWDLERSNLVGRFGPQKEFNRGLNFGGSFELVVGDNYILSEGNQISLDEVTKPLLELLPQGMHGIYAEFEP